MIGATGEVIDTSASAYRPRGAGPLVQMLSGVLTQQLVVNASPPVIARLRVETG